MVKAVRQNGSQHLSRIKSGIIQRIALGTWNCKHIANPATRKQIERTCIEAGYAPPILCTPEELLEVE